MSEPLYCLIEARTKASDTNILVSWRLVAELGLGTASQLTSILWTLSKGWPAGESIEAAERHPALAGGWRWWCSADEWRDDASGYPAVRKNAFADVILPIANRLLEHNLDVRLLFIRR